jgi:HD-GYP domain-containing protein (c-di-GMP phosphodiesterase class II)
MDGKGYPKGLTKKDIPVQGRIIALADIFEAMTARDRPYKKGKTLMQALRELGTMKQEGHIDPDLFDIFINNKIYLPYAEKYLHPTQIDEVVLSQIPGYVPPSQ